MEVIYHPEADEKVLESARFYERRSKGLGWRFLRAVQEAEARIVRSPHAFPFLDDPHPEVRAHRIPVQPPVPNRR
jgi:hypothetical protein